MTITEVLIASAVLAVLMTAFLLTFRTTAVEGASRLGFDASIKNLDAHFAKLLDHARHSNYHGVASTTLGDGMVLSIQRQDGLNSLGSLSWEEKLHLYWREDEGTKLFYTDIDKPEANAAGISLDSRYPTKPTSAQLEQLVRNQNEEVKILQTGFVNFSVSEGWETGTEALKIGWKTVNTQTPDQHYETEASLWLEAR